MPARALSLVPPPAAASGTRFSSRPRNRTEAFPAGRIVSIDTDEFDEFSERAPGWSIEYRALDATANRTSVFIVMTPALQVALVKHGTGYSSQGFNPAGTLSVAVPVDDARPMLHCGHGVGPTQMAITRSGEGFECLCRSGARFVIATMAQERLQRFAADLWHEPDVWGRSPDRLRFVDFAHRSRYLDVCERILAAVDEQPDLLRDPQAAALLEEKVLEGLLLNAQADPSGSQEPSRYNLARKAYRYLQERADEAPSIREVCAVAHASYATLERAFRETYGMTPKSMMTAMRLAGVRRTLLHPDPTTAITPVALRWGFVEFGRFSAQYRQRYGEVPSETLRRARGEFRR